jgi:shikimate kinase
MDKQKNIILLGMKHCGKSTLGRALAERWGCAFYDVDTMIEQTYACESGQSLSVREIFTQFGEASFRRLEGHAVCELYLKLDRPGSTAVVALGGRTALNETISRLLEPIGLRAYLEVDPEELFRRVAATGLPPFLDPADPKGDFLALCRRRHPEYLRQADLSVSLSGLTPQESLAELIRRIEEHTNAR